MKKHSIDVEASRMRNVCATKRKHLTTVFALCLSLTLALWTGLQTTDAGIPRNLFAKTNGSGIACTQISPCTLQTALSQAVDGDTVYVAAGKYIGKGGNVISITQSVAVLGGWNGTPFGGIVRDPAVYVSVLNGEGDRRVVYISGNITPTLDGFTIANGNATGLWSDCLEDSADGCGGGIYINSAHAIITNNTITNNVAAVTTSGYPTRTSGYGGGIYMAQTTRAKIRNNLIISNSASLANHGYGGGLSMYIYGDMSNTDVGLNRVYSNTATTANAGTGFGGGIWGGADGVLFWENLISGNQSNSNGVGSGAGIYQFFGAATYARNVVTGNIGYAGDAAVMMSNCQVRWEGNRVMDNATFNGIQIAASKGDGYVLVNNVVRHNGSKALQAYGGTSFPLTATLLHNTFTGTGAGTGIEANAYVTMNLTNTIVTGFTWGITNTVPASSTVTPDHMLFWANTNDGIRGTTPVDGNPAFLPDGYHIGIGSAAIDAGVNAGVVSDIDDVNRPSGAGYDIGAVELWFRHLFLPLILKSAP